MGQRRGSPARRAWVWCGAGAVLLGLGVSFGDAFLLTVGGLGFLVGGVLLLLAWLDRRSPDGGGAFDPLSPADSRAILADDGPGD